MTTEIDLLEHQSVFLKSPDKILAIDGAWRAGKTLPMIIDAVDECEKYPNNLIFFARHEATKLRDSTIRDFHLLYPPTSENWNAQAHDYRHDNGSVIMFRHLADRSGLVNMDLGAFYIEQAEETEYQNFDFLLGRLSRKNSSRKARITVNPNGHDWIWQLFHSPAALRWASPHLIDETKLSPDYREGYGLIRCTALDNPHLPADYVETLRTSLSPEMFDQYILGSREVMPGYRFFDAGKLAQQIPAEPILDDEGVPAVGYFVDGYPKPEWRNQENGPIRIYERYDERDSYIIGLDIATGEGDSRCAGCAINGRTTNTAAIIDADLRPDELAVQSWYMSRYFGNAVLGPERNGIGFAVVTALNQLTSNIFSEQVTEFGVGAQTAHLGWLTDARSRMELFAQLQREIASSSTELRDPELIDQCKAITMSKRGRPDPEKGFRNDLVIARGIAGMIRKMRPSVSRSAKLATADTLAGQAPEDKGSMYGFGRKGLRVAGR